METYEIYSGGEFISTNQIHKVTDKYTGDLFATTFLADDKTLDDAIKKSERALSHMRELSSLDKYAALMQISNKITEQRERLADILARESGKPYVYAAAEIDRSSHTFMIAAEESKRLPAEVMSLDWSKAGKNKEALVRYFPAGIVAGIAPFNFPMNLAVHKIAPAIAAGCSIILKPASSTPLSTLELARIIASTNLPQGAVSILPMTRETGNKLVTHDSINILSFTGSPEIGWELKSQSRKKKVILELGGNAGVIITSSAQPDQIIPKCVTGAFAYSGQICIHAQRFYVHPVHFEKFVENMKTACKSLQYGNARDKETGISNMIDENNARRVEKWVQEAMDAGAKLICGGTREKSFFEPTILTNTSAAMKVNSEEIFGPVICIEKYNGEISDAVNQINNSRYGLQCGIFTDSVQELEFAFSNLEVGGVIHNDVPTLRFDQMPYGGVKDSGLGREGVKYAIRDMMEARVLVK